MWFILLLSISAHASEVWIKVGEVRSLTAGSGKAVRVGSRGIVKVIDGENSIRVVGMKAGSTPIVVGDVHHMVHVSGVSQRDFVFALRERLKSMRGLRIEMDAGRPVLAGTLLRFRDWLEISTLAKRFQGEYFFKAQPLPDVAEEALAHFQKLARARGYPILRFRAEPRITAQIPGTARGLRAGATELFKPYGVSVEPTDSRLMLEPLVRTRVILAELSKSEGLDIGIEWPSEYQARVLPSFSGDENVLMKLKALEAHGQAQILASPNLLCRSGGEAKFHAGGEFPIRMISRHSRGVTWKEHGVVLNVKPRADFHGAISLEVHTQVSLLDQANAVDGIPALKSNTVKSHFDLPGRRTIALSGLLRQELGESREGLPYLSQIPVLGLLFSSQRFIKRQSELVIFVTPEIYSPESDEKIEMPQGWVRDDAP